MKAEDLILSPEDQDVIEMVKHGPGPGGELPVIAVKYIDEPLPTPVEATPATSIPPMPKFQEVPPRKDIGCLTSTVICGTTCMVLILAAAKGTVHPAIAGVLMFGLMLLTILKGEEL